MEEVIFKASRVPHLPAEEFPPLSDRDWALHIIKKSFPVRFRTPRIYTTHELNSNHPQYLDPRSGTVKRHMFFGFMKIFRREYIGMCLLLSLQVSSLHEAPAG